MTDTTSHAAAQAAAFTAPYHSMCPSCEHNALRSGWAPGAEQ